MKWIETEHYKVVSAYQIVIDKLDGSCYDKDDVKEAFEEYSSLLDSYLEKLLEQKTKSAFATGRDMGYALATGKPVYGLTYKDWLESNKNNRL